MTTSTFVGIDVSAEKAEVHIKNRRGQPRRETVSNKPAGHRRLLRILTQRKGPARVCLEATGVYSLDLAVALARHPDIQLAVLNPRQVKRFAEALGKRSKTDPVDAKTLCQFAETMEFEPWKPPSRATMQLRALGRRLHQLTQMRVQEKNRLHAAESTEELALLREPIRHSIQRLKVEIEEIQQMARELVNADDRLRRNLALLCSIPGVAETSALLVLAEISVLPEDMTNRQWVAHAGLDPRRHESGTVKKRSRISRQGNKYLRAALYMPAHNAIHNEPAVRRFHDRLVERGKAKMQAKVAVMRKLLHAIHGMFKYGEDFDAERFSPDAAVAKAA